MGLLLKIPDPFLIHAACSAAVFTCWFEHFLCVNIYFPLVCIINKGEKI
jgi:hypothetical protein